MTSALIAGTAIWATLPVGRLWWRLALLAVLSSTCVWLQTYLVGDTVTAIEWGNVLYGWIQAAILAGTLLVVRACGYRLIKRRMSVWQRLISRIKNQPTAEPPALPAEAAP
jgi:hypothetical protein